MIDNVITGASGFIGKRLREKLTGDNQVVPHKEISNTLFWLMPYRRFFFLSAYGNMAHQTDVAQMLGSNVGNVGTVSCATIRGGYTPESFVYVSSSSVTLTVQTPYSRTKRAAEEMLQATSLPYCIVRPYSCTGVGEQKEHLIPTLIRSCLDGEPMDFVPDATHDFVDVEDVVNGLLFLSEKRLTGIFELGSGKAVTNDEVRHLVETVCGRPANTREVKQLRAYDTPDWCCRDDTARKAGWEPHKRLVTSIREMVEVYQQ